VHNRAGGNELVDLRALVRRAGFVRAPLSAL